MLIRQEAGLFPRRRLAMASPLAQRSGYRNCCTSESVYRRPLHHFVASPCQPASLFCFLFDNVPPRRGVSEIFCGLDARSLFGRAPAAASSSPSSSSPSTSSRGPFGLTSINLTARFHQMRGCCSHASSGSAEEDPTAAGSTSTSRDSHRGGADEDAPVISFPAIAEACLELGLCCPVTGRPFPRWEAAELKARYRDLVRVNHPDVNGGDHQTMERINLAYARLSALGGAEQAGFARWIAEEGEGGYDGYLARRRWTTATRGPRLSGDTMQLVGAGLSLTVVWGAAWGVLSLFSPAQATGPTSTSASASGSGAGEGKGKGSASGPASLRQRGPASGSGRGLSWVATATPRLALVLRPLTRIAMVLFSKYLRGVVALVAVGSVLRNVFPRVVM